MLENMKGVTYEQLLLMLDAIEATPPMAHAFVLKTTRSNMFDENWNELVETLNAVPNGAKKGVQHWKIALSDWKVYVKARADEDNTMLDDLEKRLFRLIEEEVDCQAEDAVERNDYGVEQEVAMYIDTFQDPDTENIFRRPYPRRSRRQNITLDQLGAEYLTPRKERGLKILIDSNRQFPDLTHKEFMQMHLDRLHRVSQELETHIQDVQNRIQVIKDRWAHDCDDE